MVVEQRPRPLSWFWVGSSVMIFLAIELLLGGLVSDLVEGRFTSHVMRLRLEVLLGLVSYFAGGFVVGLLSPGRRLLEPAIGAALSVALAFLITFFSPWRFLSWSPDRLLVGGGIAFVIGLFGAHLGERATGN